MIDHNPYIPTYTMDQVPISIMQVVESNSIGIVVKETWYLGNKEVYEDSDVSFFA